MIGDAQIREAIHQEIRMRRPSTIVVDELKVCNGNSIVDLAILGKSLLHGIEIKSDKDTLNRLSDQAADYSKVFDFMTIVLGRTHYEKAVKIIPEWWNVWVADYENETVLLSEIRKGRRNWNIDSFSLSQFFWREEAIEIMAKEGILDGMKTKRKWLLWDKIATSLSTQSIYSHVKDTLQDRYHNHSWKNQLTM
jgi:hypothetical protein